MQREINKLTLRLLGPPEACYGGRALTFATRKTFALLIYLALEGRMHSREKIRDLFWPDSDDIRGQGALRRTVALLKQALPEAEKYLVVQRDRLGFDAKAGWDTDLDLLETAVRAGPTREALGQLRAASDAYRGDFLQGFSAGDAPDFDTWASYERERRHRQMESLFDWLSQLHAESGETGPAIDAAVRWVAHSPLNEAAHRRLMMCFFISGNRTSALQAYEGCRRVLRDELDVEPAPETEALADRIRAEAMPSHQVSRGAAIAGGTPTLESPLVGRGAEFGSLIEAYHTAGRGGPRVVSLEGEAGIGKTRLATEFAAWARAHGAPVLQGRAFEAGDRVPYQPLVEALRQVDPPLIRERLTPAWLGELSQLLPELREDVSGSRTATMGGDAGARSRLLEAVLQLTQALAGESTLILLVDDAQWADTATLDVLTYLVRHWHERNTKAMLLLTVRLESVTSGVTEWLLRVEREARTTRIALDTLTAEDTVQMVEAIASEGQAGSDREQFSKWLFTETGGQPFFIVETLKTLVEHRILVAPPGASGGWTLDLHGMHDEAGLRNIARLPQGVRTLISARLARLTPPANALLTAGAVLGHEADFNTLCRVAGLKEDEGLAALDELIRGYLMRESPSGALSITHDKIQEVVNSGAGQARKRVFHRRAMEALEDRRTSSGELVYHALAAGLSEQAFRLSYAAGDEAMWLFAVREAIRHYEQARALSTSVVAPFSEVQGLYLQLGRARELEGDFGKAEEVYYELLRAAREAGEAAAECLALNRLATLATQSRSDFEGAMSLLHEARHIAESSADKIALAETEWNLAQTAYYMSDPVAIKHGEKALELAREIAGPELVARVLNVLSWAEADFASDWERAVKHIEEARTLYRLLGNRAMESDCLCLLANAKIYEGQPQSGLEIAKSAQAISVEINNPWGKAHSAFQVSKCALEVGAYEEALEQATQGATLAVERNMPLLSVLCLSMKGTALRLLGVFGKALESHLLMREKIEAPGNAQALARLAVAELAADHAAAGDWHEAWSEIEQLKSVNLDRASNYNLLLLFDILVETVLRAGEEQSAAAMVERFRGQTDRNRRLRVTYLRAAALIALWRGETGEAISQLEEAGQLAREIGLPGETWQIDATLARSYSRIGDDERACAAVDRARATVNVLGTRIENERLRETFLNSAQRHIEQ